MIYGKTGFWDSLRTSAAHGNKAIVPGEGEDLWIEFGIKPVSLGDRRLEIVDHQCFGDAAESMEGIIEKTCRNNEPTCCRNSNYSRYYILCVFGL
ncbi:MAG: hypothetical protein AB1744_09620 [Candidatus Zixiibacteriota bacterium]